VFKLFPIELLFELGRVDTQFELFLDSDEDSKVSDDDSSEYNWDEDFELKIQSKMQQPFGKFEDSREKAAEELQESAEN
jgi:hypothetical protein